MKELRFTVPGPPQPKQRARRGKGGRFYTPKATRAYEERVRVIAWRAAGWEQPVPCRDWIQRKDPWLTTPEPVAVEVAVFWPDARRRDADNVVKSICDGLQNKWPADGVIADDSQVREFKVTTAIDRENPRVEVVVRMLDDKRTL